MTSNQTEPTAPTTAVSTAPVKHEKLVQKPSSLQIVQQRIVDLVNLHNPLDLTEFMHKYQEEYGKKLNYRVHGFAKMRGLLESISAIQIRQGETTKKGKPGGPVAVLRSGFSEHLRVKSSSGSTQDISKQTVLADETTVNTVTLDPVMEQFPTLSFFEFASKVNGTSQIEATTAGTESDDAAQDSVDLLSFLKPVGTTSMSAGRACLGDAETASHFEEYAFLGCRHTNEDDSAIGEPVFLNTHQPFCLATIGVQGAGKSHTLSCVLESCLLHDTSDEVIRLKNPITALVLHYDQSTTSVCEAAGLLTPSPRLPDGAIKASVPREKATILVSPTYYKQRKAFYGDYCTVRPLLFRWNSLTADHIKRIMGITRTDNQLYVSSFMTLLRRYQRQAVIPSFSQFLQEIKKLCSVKGQTGPLEQRIALLESVIAESSVNADIATESMDIGQAMAHELDLIIVDLTDPLLAKEEANGLFQVVTEQFRTSHAKGGKLLCLDEAHKFLDGTKADGLSEAIINVARLMRHDGIRLVVSTQSPKALAPEVLELVSVAVLHHFHSEDWFTYIRQKLPLSDEAWETILSLGPGNALVFASRSNSHATPMVIRGRLTSDFGASRVNK